YSPIILFVHSRLEHTIKTINSLKKNELASESDLIVYSDGPRNFAEAKKVEDVRAYLADVDGFKSVVLVIRESNYGLARNIIEGVSEIIDKYGSAI
ncbi:hypothetical protein, partial [Vibrio harveyi]|uniref:hypothetical protein n=1 Tax=Vibrio harveyi TaxID=669 RepID=UPI000A5B27AC